MGAITQVPFFPSDWLAGTRGMTAAEMGVYITLIAMMYERAGPIPGDDLPKLARLCGTSASALRGILDSLISDGKITRQGDMLFNRRAELEIKNVMSKSEVARASAEARWGKKQDNSKAGLCDGNAKAMLAISHKPVDKINNQISSNNPPARTASEPTPARPFPSDGSISFGPFAEIARKAKPGVDPDVVASAFRRFCRTHDPPIPLDAPNIGKRFEGFARGHSIGRVN